MPIENPASVWIKKENKGELQYEYATSPDGIWAGMEEDEWRKTYNRTAESIDRIASIWQRNRNLTARELTMQAILYTILSDEDLSEVVLQHVEEDVIPYLETIKRELGLLH